MKKIIVFIILVTINSAVSSAVITYKYTFTTTAANVGTPSQGDLFLGNTISGSFVYETNIQNRLGESLKQYNLTSHLSSLEDVSLNTGVTNTAMNTANRIRIYNAEDSGHADLISLSSTLNQNFNGYNLTGVGLVFSHGDDTAIDTSDLTENPFSEFDTHVGRLFFTPVDDVYAGYYVQGDLALSHVPLPAAIWLFGSGLIGLVGLARRKKS